MRLRLSVFIADSVSPRGSGIVAPQSSTVPETRMYLPQVSMCVYVCFAQDQNKSQGGSCLKFATSSAA